MGALSRPVQLRIQMGRFPVAWHPISLCNDILPQRLIENITCEYKRADEEELNIINKKAAEIAKNLELSNRMQKHTQSQCYVTFKDHKNNFMDKKP